ncbi:transmembrane protein 80 isoform X2 [Monodelphis domestica]|uniref:transmembrane protein 80 isoform X2 n=1 Tax=Monodelphis domestica TaxID=13616 RepID=UPI0024E1E904|nr:transmembrane protein 80 isoform X2 [Monodelphis domestica]
MRRETVSPPSLKPWARQGLNSLGPARPRRASWQAQECFSCLPGLRAARPGRIQIDPVLSQRPLFPLLLPGLPAHDGLLQKTLLHLPPQLPGHGLDPSLRAGPSGSPAAPPGEQREPGGGRAPAGRQPRTHRPQHLPVCVLPAVGHLRAAGRRLPQHRPAGLVQPGGHPADGDHRRLPQLAAAPPFLMLSNKILGSPDGRSRSPSLPRVPPRPIRGAPSARIIPVCWGGGRRARGTCPGAPR